MTKKRSFQTFVPAAPQACELRGLVAQVATKTVGQGHSRRDTNLVSCNIPTRNV